MIRAIALANVPYMYVNSKIVKDEIFLVEDSEDIFWKNYYRVYSLDKVYLDIIRKEWFILESLHLGILREKQIKSVLE
jgi:hypothetical protein